MDPREETDLNTMKYRKQLLENVKNSQRNQQTHNEREKQT